jgi:hypothetical protein
MPTRPCRIGAFAVAGVVAFGALAVVLGNQADAKQPAPVSIDQLLGQELQGRVALGRVQSRLAEGQANSATPTGLSASLNYQVVAGRYYLRVENSGYGNPLNTGYSTYGSRGAYTVRLTAA